MQCRAVNHACQCIRTRHAWWEPHWSYGRKDFIWYWWSKKQRDPSVELALKLRDKEPDKRL